MSIQFICEAGSAQDWQLLDGNDEPWLQCTCCGVYLTDGTSLLSSDPRYKVCIDTQGDLTIAHLTDTRKQLDQTWTIVALDDRCFTFALTVVNRGDEPLELAQISLLEGVFAEQHEPGKPHVLLNGISTSPPLPTTLSPETEELKSAETIAMESPALAAGFLTGKHNLGRFTIANPDGKPVFRALGDCNGCLLMPGASRQTDRLFVSLHDNPLRQLERYADMAAELNGATVWPPRVAWCTWYSGWITDKMATYREGVEKGVEENIPLVRDCFAGRGGSHTMRICDDFSMYGDWVNKTHTISGGFRRLAQLISEAGLTPGVWYVPYWASTASEVYKRHPEWFARNADGSVCLIEGRLPQSRRAPAFAIFDTSRPDVQQYFEDTARSWRKRGFRYVTTDFLGSCVTPQRYHDPTMTKAEVMRCGLEAIRRGLGEDVFYRTIGGLIGAGMGLTNDLRLSGDSHGDNPAAYFRTAQVWFYNRRLWLNDPSAVVCARYGELKPIEWNQMWLSWIALSGTVMTYGEVLEELPDQYVRMYQRLFPPLPAAGRPLDLWENSPYLLWGMDPGPADGPYVLFGVFDVQGDGPRRVRLNLDEITARCRGWATPESVPENYLLWDFWQRRLVRSQLETIELTLRARSCHLFSLRPMLGRPQLLGTDGHFSQGAVETSDVVWRSDKGELCGNVRGNGGDPSTLFFHVPEKMQLSSATLHGTQVNVRHPEPHVLAVDIPALAQPARLLLHFSGDPVKVGLRPYVPGRAATRSERWE
jgi:hypothetical protein